MFYSLYFLSFETLTVEVSESTKKLVFAQIMKTAQISIHIVTFQDFQGLST